MIDVKTKHKRLAGNQTVWTEKKLIYSAFDCLFQKFQDSALVVSYRADGIPKIEELMDLLKKYKKDVWEIDRKQYKYALSVNNSEEALIIGT
jgi:adenine-specific DNA-methyltransferase